MGHKAVIIIGDYTAPLAILRAEIKTRKMLSGEEIDAKCQNLCRSGWKDSALGSEASGDPLNGEWLGR